MPKRGIFWLKSPGICLSFGNSHQNNYYFHQRNHHFHYQNQFELDSVKRAEMSFLGAGKRTTGTARLGEGWWSELNGPCPFKMIFLKDIFPIFYMLLKIISKLALNFPFNLAFYFHSQFVKVNVNRSLCMCLPELPTWRWILKSWWRRPATRALWDIFLELTSKVWWN